LKRKLQTRDNVSGFFMCDLFECNFSPKYNKLASFNLCYEFILSNKLDIKMNNTVYLITSVTLLVWIDKNEQHKRIQENPNKIRLQNHRKKTNNKQHKILW